MEMRILFKKQRHIPVFNGHVTLFLNQNSSLKTYDFVSSPKYFLNQNSSLQNYDFISSPNISFLSKILLKACIDSFTRSFNNSEHTQYKNYYIEVPPIIICIVNNALDD